MYAMYFVAVGSLAALLFAASMFAKVKKQPEGNSEMIRISTAVREGANAYLKRQYKGIGIFFAVMFVILLVMAFSGFSQACPVSSVCVPPQWQTAGRRREHLTA